MRRSDRKNLKKQLDQIEVPTGLKKIDKMSLNFVLPLVLFYCVIGLLLILLEDWVTRISAWVLAAGLLISGGWLTIRYIRSKPEKRLAGADLAAGLILLLEWSIFRKMLPSEIFPNGKTGKYFAVNAGAFIILLTAFFGIVMPQSCEMLRTEKPFFIQLGKYLEEHHIRNDQIYFFHHNYTNGSFYLRQPRKIAVLDHEDEVQPEKLGTGLGQLIRQKRTGKVLIIGQMRYFRKISDPVLRKEVLDKLQWIEGSGPLENPKKNGKKNAVLVLN